VRHFPCTSLSRSLTHLSIHHQTADISAGLPSRARLVCLKQLGEERSSSSRRRQQLHSHTCRRHRREPAAHWRIRRRPTWRRLGEARGGTRPSTWRRRSPRRRPTPPCPLLLPPLAGLLVSASGWLRQCIHFIVLCACLGT